MSTDFVDAQRAFVAFLRDPEHVSTALPADRAQVYQSLIYSNIESLLRSGFPVLRSLDDDARWQARVRAFIRDHRCVPAEFHRAAGCFVDFCFEKPDALADDWPFLAELAHYEWVEMVLAIAPDRVDWSKRDTDDDWVLSPLAAVLAYHAPVHAIGPGFADAVPEQPSTFLAVRRTRRDAVQFMQLNALTYQLLSHLRETPEHSIHDALAGLVAQLPQLAEALQAQAPGLIQHLADSDVLVARTSLTNADWFADSDPHLRLPLLRT